MTMLRYVQMPCSIALVLLIAMPANARGADAPPYAVSAEAVQMGKQITVSISLTKPLEDGGTETVAAPRVIIESGKRATIAISTGPSSDVGTAQSPSVGGAAPSPPLPSPERTTTRPSQQPVTTLLQEPDSGLRIDLISIKGKDKAILLTTVFEKGDTTWAEAKTIDVTVAPPAAKQ